MRQKPSYERQTVVKSIVVMVFYLKIAQEITPDELFDSSRALQKKAVKREETRRVQYCSHTHVRLLHNS